MVEEGKGVKECWKGESSGYWVRPILLFFSERDQNQYKYYSSIGVNKW